MMNIASRVATLAIQSSYAVRRARPVPGSLFMSTSSCSRRSSYKAIDYPRSVPPSATLSRSPAWHLPDRENTRTVLDIDHRAEI
jgi:hypothetical protein